MRTKRQQQVMLLVVAHLSILAIKCLYKFYIEIIQVTMDSQDKELQFI